MFQKLLEKRQKFEKRVNSGEAEYYDLHTCTCCSRNVSEASREAAEVQKKGKFGGSGRL
jgi:hypothetical protein